MKQLQTGEKEKYHAATCCVAPVQSAAERTDPVWADRCGSGRQARQPIAAPRRSHCRSQRSAAPAAAMALLERDSLFKRLRSKPENKVCAANGPAPTGSAARSIVALYRRYGVVSAPLSSSIFPTRRLKRPVSGGPRPPTLPPLHSSDARSDSRPQRALPPV